MELSEEVIKRIFFFFNNNLIKIRFVFEAEEKECILRWIMTSKEKEIEEIIIIR